LVSNGILNRAFTSIAGVQKSSKFNSNIGGIGTGIRGLGSAGGGQQRRRTSGAGGFATILHSADGDEDDAENNFR
jgi:hypothetical protein